ncbi:MAG TPA: histidine kinase [Holophagaceae bacterium]|nr:histidine kinase [Holophagaceae bacterium]
MRAPALARHFRRRISRPIPWVVMVIFWVIFSSFYFLISGHLSGSRSILIFHAIFSPGLASFSYCFLSGLPWRYTGDDRLQAPFPRGLVQALLFNTLLIAILTAVALAILRAGGIVLPDTGFTGGKPNEYFHQMGAQLIFALPIFTVIGGLITISETVEEEKTHALEQLQEAQWILLRGQLSPHVLFNALNGLAELVHRDADAAEAALLDLAGLYRALLDHGDKIRAPLGDERRLLERYLGVESMRLGSRLKVLWDWDTGLDRAQAPPFLLQPLVENAIKHGISSSAQGGELRIEARRQLYGTVLRVANTGLPPRLVLGHGVGLANLEARLRLAYKGRASFRLFEEEAWTVAEITLPEAG